MKTTYFFLLSVLFAATGIANADEVYLVNGDKISGKVVKMVDGKMTFKSDMAGEIVIPMENISTLTSTEPAELKLVDGTVLKQSITKGEQGQIVTAGSETIGSQQIRLVDIAVINPEPKPVPKWKGDASAGITSSHGNTKTESTQLSINLSKRTQNDRTKLNADYARAKQRDPDTNDDEVTEHWWKTRAKYDYFLSKKHYIYADGRYEKDSIAKIDRRFIIGGGTGYQWIESEDVNFSTEAGLASLYEKYEDSTDSNTELSAQAGYHFDKKLAKNLFFINDFTYYPSTEQVSDYYMTTSAELRAMLNDNMFTNFKVIFDYDSTPAANSTSTDTKYILGAGWKF